MSNTVNNASKAEYWISVKQRAAIRNGLAIFKSREANLPRRTYYTAYLQDRCDLISQVSAIMGFNAAPALSDEFRSFCADAMKGEELKATKVVQIEDAGWLPF